MKLNAVIIDSDRPALELVKGYCHDSKLVNVVETFNNPREFVDASPSIDFDLYLLDINLPVIDGLTVVRMLNGKPFIFVTASNTRLREAMEASPVAIISKPVMRERLNDALAKAHYNLSHTEIMHPPKKEFGAFFTNHSRSKTLLKLSDILFVCADDKDARNKNVLMRDGKTHLLMNCKFDDLLSITPGLVRINKSELVLMEMIKGYGHDVISIEFPLEKNTVKQFTLSRTFKKDFHNRISLL